MSKYLSSKQESKHKLTRQQVYHHAKYTNVYTEQLMDELGVRYVNI